MVILGPDGDTLSSPDSAFKDAAAFTAEVKALNLQLPSFRLSADFLRQGKPTQSVIAKGQGLLGASDLKLADDAFATGAQRARQEHDNGLEQLAQLGHAKVEMMRWQAAHWQVNSPSGQAASRRGLIHLENVPSPQAAILHILEPITAHPANDPVAAQAWYLTGIVRLLMRDLKAAGEAYKNAYRLSQKPSQAAEGARRELDMLGIAVEEEAAAAAGGVHLAMPRREVMAGSIEVVATAPGATKVEFFLDDARVTERSSAPFTASISLGTLPRAHTIKVVAFDAAGRSLGEDAATVNDRVSSLSVHITEPRGGTIESHAVVVLQARVPAGIVLQSVVLYWNEEKLATMTAPPFRYELTLPAKNASGYLRAVAHDTSGGVAEDAKLINAGGVSDSARIDAVELYAIVQDHSGHTIEGLTAADFEVKEDGQPVKADLHSAAADPITVGIAVDTSGSMRVSMAAVIEYVAEFVQTSLAENDQALLIAFDSQPHILQPLTSDLHRFRSDLSAVEPSGETAVWDSVIYALQQLRAARGRRALLVFTDGNDNASRTDPAAAIQIAHETGVPVYVVLIYSGEGNAMVNGRATPRHQSGPSSLEQLANATGGTVFRYPKRADLPKLFAQVRDDTRGEYLLSYVSHSTKPPSEMRNISIAVPSRHAIVRAMAGYYAP
jgi:Ca-activated chloride channel homolog